MNDIKQEIRDFITENLVYSENGIAYADDASLLENGVLDSFGVMEVIAFVEEGYDVNVEDREIVPDNFDSVESIAAYVTRKTTKENGTVS
jgi:acyl carrier protein